jgi:hypothetical protein
MFLVISLHLRGGASRSTSNIVLQALALLLGTAFQLFGRILTALGHDINIPSPDIPNDIRTCYKALGIEAEITRTVSCPKCFALYQVDNIPEICGWKQSPRARPCAEPLWTKRKTRNGAKAVPRSLYSTQSMASWLQFFLQRQGIESLLAKSYTYQPRPGQKMTSVWESPAWQSLASLGENAFAQRPGNLTFSLYIDWFNPLTNKIAGKQISCGAILLCCMNLPEELRYLPENVFFVGITPGPKSPDVIQIHQILRPMVDELRQLWDGIIIPTYEFPLGRLIRVVAVFPLIADLQAIRKASGFLAHSAHRFCSYCCLTIDDIASVDVEHWVLRETGQVRNTATEWHRCQTIKDRQALAKETGIRWSPLYDLPYFDPIRHLVLGFMHNTLEGILQTHLRDIWKIGPRRKVKEEVEGDVLGDEEYEEEIRDPEDDVSEMDTEAEELENEDALMRISPEPIAEEVQPVPEEDDDGLEPVTQEEYDTDDSDETDFTEFGIDSFSFSRFEIQGIRALIRDIELPTWVGRPPSNLGEASHGKLKASEYLTLFTIIFPLLIPEFWHYNGSSSYEDALLRNFYHLVASTNIIASYSTSELEAEAYTRHMIAYRNTMATCYKDVNPKPNHHYALHNEGLLKFWGPLASLSEFKGEQTNHLLQLVKTNKQIRTFMHQNPNQS